MIKSLPHKSKKFFYVLIKLSIVFGALFFIYKKLIDNNELEFSVFIDFTLKNRVFSLRNVVFLLFLSFFNWFFEILKWKNLVAFIKKVSFKEALAQSLGSLTASLITPNRIGEYGAKALYFLPKQRKKIMLINLMGNMLQMGVTVIFGIVGLFYFIKTYQPEINYYKLSRFVTVILTVFILLALGVSKNNFRIKGFSFERIKSFIIKFPKSKIALALLFSVIRYVIFSFQFYFLLMFFDINFSYLQAMVIITSMYLLASLIPTIFIFDVVIKGSVAVYLFSLAGVNELVVLSVVTIMWFFNFVLPSIIGSYYVFRFKFPKKPQYS